MITSVPIIVIVYLFFPSRSSRIGILVELALFVYSRSTIHVLLTQHNRQPHTVARRQRECDETFSITVLAVL